MLAARPLQLQRFSSSTCYDAGWGGSLLPWREGESEAIVWMRTAALPNFRKLFRRVEHTIGTDFEKGLPANREYQLVINYTYPVTQFSGTKSVIIATTSILGGKNPFLGIAYIVVGCICFIIGIIFLFIHLRFGRTTQEMLNIGPNSQYNSS